MQLYPKADAPKMPYTLQIRKNGRVYGTLGPYAKRSDALIDAKALKRPNHSVAILKTRKNYAAVVAALAPFVIPLVAKMAKGQIKYYLALNRKEQVAYLRKKARSNLALRIALRKDATASALAEMVAEALKSGAGDAAIEAATVAAYSKTGRKAPARKNRRNKRPTYKAARLALWSYFGTQGWKLSNPRLKNLWATSPDGRLRLWFKAQSIYTERGPGPWSINNAHSLTHGLDIRDWSPARFYAAIGKRYPAIRTNKAKHAPWIKHEGKLGGPGFLSKPDRTQKALLNKAVKKWGYRSTLGSIMVLERNRKINRHYGKKLTELRHWLVKKYGGPGSFGPR